MKFSGVLKAIFNLIHVCFRFGKARHSLCDGEKGGHQDHQQGQVDGVGAAEGRAGDRHHEADRAPPRPRTLRRLREQEVPVSTPEKSCPEVG